MSRTSIACLFALALALAPSVARADIQKSGPEVWPGKNDVSVHLGFQTGLSSYGTGGGPPGGFKLFLDYSFRFQDGGAYTLWLNFGVNLVVGGGCGATAGTNLFVCGTFSSGDAVEPFAGVQLKFKTPIPLVPYVKGNLIVDTIFQRHCGEYGVAVGARIGGGVKYFLTKMIGVGIDTGFSLGPAYYTGVSATCDVHNFFPSHTEFFATFDFGVGAEFVF